MFVFEERDDIIYRQRGSAEGIVVEGSWRDSGVCCMLMLLVVSAGGGKVRAEHVEVKLPASSTASKLLGFNDRRHRHIEIFNFLNRF